MRWMMTILLILLTSITAWGNAGPPSQSPSDQQLIFEEGTGVALREEWIRLEIFDEDLRQGRFDVTYHLENTTGEERNIELLFIAQKFPEFIGNAEFTVQASDVEISEFTEVTGDDLPTNWQADFEAFNIDPVGERELSYSYEDYGRADRDQQIGYRFEVFLPESGITELEISYNTYAGYYDYREVINPINTQIYYLSPAGFWDGEVQVNYAVVLPGEDFEIYSNLPLQKAAKGAYHGSVYELPESEWMVNYVSTSGLYFNTNNPMIHNGIVTALILLIITAGFFLRKRNRIIGSLFMLLIIPALLLYTIPYGTWYMIIYLWPVILIIIFYAAVFYYRRRYTNRGYR